MLHKWLVLVILILGAAATFPHVLQKIEQQLRHAEAAYTSGEHSQAYSRMMAVKLQLDELHAEMGMEGHRVQPATENCSTLLQRLVSHTLSPNWLQEFEEFEQSLEQLAATCTNADYPMDSSLESVESFKDHCAVCVVVLRIMENYISYHRKDVVAFVSKEFCQFFNGTLKPTCQAFIATSGPILINSLVTKEPADRACLRIGLCKNPNCTFTSESMKLLGQANIGTLEKNPSWTWLIHLFTKHFGDQHFPPFDLDNDTFSDVSTFRGYHWRGTDCDELNPKVYPGRKSGNKLIDHDCNGIFGKADTGKLYEDMWCSGAKRFGVAVLGDSAGAHFSIPEKYMNVSLMTKGVYHDFLRRAADELDLPMESAYTAHTQTDYLSHSVYKFVREWNLCNNNDYQNTGVNGARTTNCQTNFKALVRDQTEDNPLLIFLELIGNDVCSSDMGMTTVPDFRRNLQKLLGQLDARVPAGSLLISFGLAEGEILYDNLHDDKHPLNITYSTLYDFLNCLKISPCFGWLNSNETYRKMTTQRARELSAVYQEIIDTTTFKNFKMVYYDFPTMDLLARRVMQGGDPKMMIEKCDGFHPSGLFHSYLADWIWAKLRTEHRAWLGQPNPHNAEIRKKFNMTVFKDPLHPESE